MSSVLDPNAEHKRRYPGRPRKDSEKGTPDATRRKVKGTVHRRPDEKLSTREALVARLAFQGFAAREIAAETNLKAARVSQIANEPRVVEEIHRLQTMADTEIIKTVRDRAIKIQTKLYDEFDATFNKLVSLRDDGGPRDNVQMQAAKLLFDRAFDTNVIPATVRAKLATEAMNAKNQPPTLNIYVTAQEAGSLTSAIDEALELTPGLDYTDAPSGDPDSAEPQDVGTSGQLADDLSQPIDEPQHDPSD